MTRRDFIKTSTAAASAAALSSLPIERSAYANGSDIIKVGLIGCGQRGAGAAAQACSADPGVRIVALGDLFESRLDESLSQLKKTKGAQITVDREHQFVGFDAYKKVIESADVVLIACASKFHPIYAKAALEAGKHVFLEKPHAIDPHGIGLLKEAIEVAKQKKLCLVSGLQSRYSPPIQETIQRIHDGQIGEIISIEENFLRGPYRLFPREPGQDEIHYQFFNWYHFSWLSGDDVIQSLVHNLDRASWALREQAPLKAHGMGGRSSSIGEVYGDVFDHHAVVYEYANGVRLYAFCRTEVGCYDESSSIVLGSKGQANLTRHFIKGEKSWRYEGPATNPYEIEHQKLFQAIRAGTPLNNGDYMVRSTLIAIMGQLTCYSGKEITWENAMASKFAFLPKEADFTTTPPVTAKDGIYPCAVPGVTKI